MTIKEKVRNLADKASAFYEDHKFFVGYTTGVVVSTVAVGVTAVISYKQAVAENERLWDGLDEEARDRYETEDAFAAIDRNERVIFMNPTEMKGQSKEEI